MSDKLVVNTSYLDENGHILSTTISSATIDTKAMTIMLPNPRTLPNGTMIRIKRNLSGGQFIIDHETDTIYIVSDDE